MLTRAKEFIGTPFYDIPPATNFAAEYLAPMCTGAETYFKNVFKLGQRNVPGEIHGEGATLLAKLYRTSIGNMDRWFDGLQTLSDVTVLVINPEKDKANKNYGPTNALIDMGTHLFLGKLDPITGEFVLGRPVRGLNAYDYHYQTQMRRMYTEFLAELPHGYEAPAWNPV